MQGAEHKPTPETRARVATYVENGVARNRIASALRISEPTLRKHYADELEEADGLWEAKFEESLGARVLQRDCPPALLIFLAKTRLRYREIVAEDPDVKKPTEMTDDELRDAIAARERLRRAGQGAATKGKRTDVAA